MSLTLDDIINGKLYTLAELSLATGASYSTLWRAARNGDLVSVRVGGIRVMGKDFKDYLERRKTPAPRPRAEGPKPQGRPFRHLNVNLGG
jgi:hypothetical protein